MDKVKPKEIEPLLMDREFTFHSMKEAKHHRKLYEEDDDDDLDENFEDEILLTETRKKRRVGLLWQDFVLLTLDFFQILALIQSMALRWMWSFYWINNAYFFFLFNLDVWEFMKIYNGKYLDIKNRYMPSVDVGFEYWYLAVMWLVIILVLGLGYLLIYLVLKKREPSRLADKLAWLRRIYFYIIQLLSMPFGTAVFHLFQCNEDGNVDVMNTQVCFAGFHWLYLSFGLIFVVFVFVVFPVYVVVKARRESVGSCSKHHESFLLLKETEYKVGLSKVWLICDFYLFSSYRFWGLYHRAIMMWIKLTLLIVFAAGFKDISGQSWAMFGLLLVYFVGSVIIRPYRVPSYNFLLSLSFLGLMCLSLLGAMRTKFNPYTLDTPWFLPQYSRWLLTMVVIIWLFVWFVLLIYLVIRQIRYRCNVSNLPVWPTFTTSADDWLSPQARKFLKTFLRSRHVLEETKRGLPMFAPVHDLARQIRILNAYCREAEFLGDALHGIMWDLLDEMIEVHSELNQKSLFAESVKESIRKTAREFLTVMPAFAQRLAQRDYDFILVDPVKKRMLLKMFCMGVFLNGRSEKLAKVQLLTKPALDKIWQETTLVQDIEEEGYYEDLFPDPLEVESDTSLDLSMESYEDDQDDISFTRLYSQLPQTTSIDPSNFLRPESAVSSAGPAGFPRPQSGPSTSPRPQSGRPNPLPELPGSPQLSSELPESRPTSRPNSGSSVSKTVLSRPNSATVGALPTSRPTSASSRPVSASSGPHSARPSSAISDPKNRISRPNSGTIGSRPTTALSKNGDEGHTNPGFIPEEQNPQGDQGSNPSVDIVTAASAVIDMEPTPTVTPTATPTATPTKKKKLTKKRDSKKHKQGRRQSEA